MQTDIPLTPWQRDADSPDDAHQAPQLGDLQCAVSDRVIKSHWIDEAADPRDLQHMWELWAARLYRFCGRLAGAALSWQHQTLTRYLERIDELTLIKGIAPLVRTRRGPVDLCWLGDVATALSMVYVYGVTAR